MLLIEIAKQVLGNVYASKPSSFKASFSLINAFLRSIKKEDITENDVVSNKTQNELVKQILLSDKSRETKRKLLLILAALLKKIHAPLKTKAEQRCYVEYTNLKRDLISSRKANVAISDKEANALSLDFSELRQKFQEKLDQRSLLYNMFVFIDETPRLEYRILTLHNPKSPSSNFLKFVAKKAVIVLNVYKTSKKYGTWTIKVENPKLNKYIHDYVTTKKMKPGDDFFKNSKSEPFASNKFSEEFQSAFQAVTNTKVNLNSFRKLKENALFHKNPEVLKMSLKEREKWVEKHFKHSLATSMLYYNRVEKSKTSLTNTSEETRTSVSAKENNSVDDNKKKDIQDFRENTHHKLLRRSFADEHARRWKKKISGGGIGKTQNVNNFLLKLKRLMKSHRIDQHMLINLLSIGPKRKIMV